MCVVSMIMDKFEIDFKPWTAPNAPIENPETLKEVIAKFHAARAAAGIVDEAMGAADCEDAEKIKLVERVAELEQALKDALGTYILKEGSWYLSPSGAYTTRSEDAQRFQGKDDAELVAEKLVPRPRCVKLVKR